MTKIRTLQILRGTTAQNDAYTGSAGELTMDTTRNELRLHDGTTAGGHKIAGYHPDLFDFKWADHVLNDAQWLRADTFSWQYGSMYQAAYANLSTAIAGKTLQSETVAGITVQFYLADDGHKICPASEETNVSAIYNATGVAWYYIIDTTNQRFKLPRAKHEKFGNIPVVGNGKTLGLTNGWVFASPYQAINNPVGLSGAAVDKSLPGSIAGLSTDVGGLFGVATDPTKSGMVAQQEQDTDQYKHLYFYVGAFTQTAIENTAGLNTELFNEKADVSTVAHVVTEFQAPTVDNGYIWYRKYRDGWVEQGGIINDATTGVFAITLPVLMLDNNYNIQLTGANNNSSGLNNTALWGVRVNTKTTSTFTTCGNLVNNSSQTTYLTEGVLLSWEVKGMAAN